MSIQAAKANLEQIKEEIQKGIIGQSELIEALLLTLISRGHALIEGVPGLAKTRAVNLLANATGLPFHRIQFTPDLLPADIIGTRIYNQSTASFETRRGPVFTSFILADEINRAPAKVQSALLEAMQEKQVTIGDETFKLPRPFFVFATQNPVEQEGTYPLPEAQVDRFMLKVNVGYPNHAEEKKIVDMVINETELPEVSRVVDDEQIIEAQNALNDVFLEPKIVQYITTIIQATRRPSDFNLALDNALELGSSPRGSIALARTAKAHALLNGRNEVYPEDVKTVAPFVLQHRLIMTYHAQAEGLTPLNVITRILSKVKVP